MDKSWYIDECNRQLNDTKFYRQLDGDITDTIQPRVTVDIERMFNDSYINKKTKKYLVQTNVKPGRFNILPKIHKTGNPGRPIVSSNSHPTERFSQFMTTTLTLSSLPKIHTLKTLLNSLINFLTSVTYLTTLFL